MMRIKPYKRPRPEVTKNGVSHYHARIAPFTQVSGPPQALLVARFEEQVSACKSSDVAETNPRQINVMLCPVSGISPV